MLKNVNLLNWFEIPVKDMERAQAFYEKVFDVRLQRMDFPSMQMLMFPMEPGSGKLGGALVKSDQHVPSDKGVVIYFNGDPDLDVALCRVESAGGRVIMQKTRISDENGYMAFFSDTEGNNLALHSMG